jgi:hypothetical protein
MNSFSRMLCNYLYGLLLPETFLKFGTPRVDGCSSAIVFSPFLFLLFFFFFSRFHVSTPSLYSLMCAIGCLLSIVPHAGEILLEMLAVDSYW